MGWVVLRAYQGMRGRRGVRIVRGWLWVVDLLGGGRYCAGRQAGTAAGGVVALSLSGRSI